MANIDVEKTLSQLTIAEKISLTAGIDFWHTADVPRLKVPSLRLSDGPNGVRGTRFFNGVPAACLPCATALGATFDTNLINSVGQLLGAEAKAKGAHVLLGPTINIQRSPLGGRGFESFSEDPFLSGTLAGAYCAGVQHENVIATVKHFVCNDQEHERMAVNSILTDRALREIYLMPFMLAIKIGKPHSVMTAYNKVNGTHVSEDPTILDILRKEWRWEGLLMSDWFGTYSTSGAVNAGLDLEMPGPTRWRGSILNHAITSKKVYEYVLDERVREVLKAVKQAAKSGIPENAKEGVLDRPEDRALLRKAAADSIVLLKDDSKALPFSKSKPIAIIGPNSKVATYCGGGSASLKCYYAITPFDAVSAACQSSVHFSQGAYSHKELPALGKVLQTPDGKEGFTFRAYDKSPGNDDRQLLDTVHLTDSYVFLVDYKAPKIQGTLYYADMEGIFIPEEDGTYDFGVTVCGTARLFVDGKLLVDNATVQRPGESFFGLGTKEEIGSTDLKAGTSYHIRVEFGTAPTTKLANRNTMDFGAGGVRFGGCKRIDRTKAIEAAAKLASEVNQVVVFAGLNGDWETEGHDRPNMDLPPGSDDLISKVLAANPNAVIFNQSGTPVTMPWINEAKTIVQAWYGGNETGNAIADVLYGDVNPSGKLSLTFPVHLRDNPSYLNYGSERGRVLYGEDIFVGYRYYDTAAIAPLFPFGHGLSYTCFELSNLVVSSEPSTVKISVDVGNGGDRAGAEVIQVYVTAREPSVRRPEKELKGFRKILVKEGTKESVEVELDRKYAASFWDEERMAWIIEKGKYRIFVGNSSRGKMLEGEFEVEKTEWWTGL